MAFSFIVLSYTIKTLLLIYVYVWFIIVNTLALHTLTTRTHMYTNICTNRFDKRLQLLLRACVHILERGGERYICKVVAVVILFYFIWSIRLFVLLLTGKAFFHKWTFRKHFVCTLNPKIVKYRVIDWGEPCFGCYIRFDGVYLSCCLLWWVVK